MSKFKIGDKVRILDGSNIKRYTGAWNKEHMGSRVGEVHKITHIDEDWGNSPCAAYGLDIGGFLCNARWDERGLELVNDQKIVITTDGKTTTAVLYDGKQRIKEAKAICAPSDAFDFNYGATLVLDRLTGFVRGSVDNTLDTRSQMDRFIAGEIAIEVPNGKTKNFLKECERRGLKWFSGHLPTKLNTDEKYFICEDNCLFCSFAGRNDTDYVWETWDGAKNITEKEKRIVNDAMSALESYIKHIKDDLDD